MNIKDLAKLFPIGTQVCPYSNVERYGIWKVTGYTVSKSCSEVWYVNIAPDKLSKGDWKVTTDFHADNLGIFEGFSYNGDTQTILSHTFLSKEQRTARFKDSNEKSISSLFNFSHSGKTRCMGSSCSCTLSDFNPCQHCIDTNNLVNICEETNMELKDIKPSNLKEAKKQFDEQRSNAEIAFAKQELLKATNEIDRLDQEIKVREEAKAVHVQVLMRFK